MTRLVIADQISEPHLTKKSYKKKKNLYYKLTLQFYVDVMTSYQFSFTLDRKERIRLITFFFKKRAKMLGSSILKGCITQVINIIFEISVVIT